MQPSFTIITVTYNAEAVLERTLKSVLNQTYQHIEYIIVDGASTDGTKVLLDKYSSQISKIISEKDSGIYDAMNKGLNAATGNYVWFMNAGDTIYCPETVQHIVDQLSQLSTLPDIIYGETAIVDINEQFLYMRRLKAPESLTWKSFGNGMLVCHQAFIVKQSISQHYNLHYRLSADYDWCIRCMKQSNINYNTHLTLTNYLNEGETTRNLKASLKERFVIMSRHYGTIITVIRHIKFLIRYTLSNLTNKS